jgi:hypothetical protein
MADIDVLISPRVYNTVESAILSRGYERQSDCVPGEHAHHGIPLFQAKRQVWVELHTTLFPSDDSLRANELFSPVHVDTQAISSSFHGRHVKRLTDELQLVYIASSWMRDVTLFKIQPSYLISLLDALYLLKRLGGTVDWKGLLASLDNDMAKASLYVMLTYLSRLGFNPCVPAILGSLAAGQKLVGALQLKAIHAMLDHYLIGGRYWNVSLPPPVPGRYSLRNQLRKRWPRTWSRRST